MQILKFKNTFVSLSSLALACCVNQMGWTQSAFALSQYKNPGSQSLNDGLLATELPKGGEITVPGDFPVHIPAKTEVTLSALKGPQSISFSNGSNTVQSEVRIYANHERYPRILKIRAGVGAVYSLAGPVRVRVTNGTVKVNSVLPLTVHR